ncbi:MAG: NUDIX domain-containing protein [Salibacteraceae bacterium]
MNQTQKIKLSVDAVVFGYSSEKGILILLIKRNSRTFRGSWALPGGLVRNEESLEEAAKRELNEETGVSINFLEQLYTFGTPDRDPRNRAVSVAYYALVSPDAFTLQADTDASAADWFSIEQLPELAFDHQEIVATALKRLRSKVLYQPVGFELLEEKFPFSDLENLYQTLLGYPIDRRNFRKKVLKFGFVEATTERQKHAGSGRPGFLFRFNRQRYHELVEQGIHFEL